MSWFNRKSSRIGMDAQMDATMSVRQDGALTAEQTLRYHALALASQRTATDIHVILEVADVFQAYLRDGSIA